MPLIFKPLNQVTMTKEMFYYDLHVFHGLEDGYGRPIKSEKELTDSEVIDLAVSLGEIPLEDATRVDYIDPMSEEEYNNY